MAMWEYAVVNLDGAHIITTNADLKEWLGERAEQFGLPCTPFANAQGGQLTPIPGGMSYVSLDILSPYLIWQLSWWAVAQMTADGWEPFSASSGDVFRHDKETAIHLRRLR